MKLPKILHTLSRHLAKHNARAIIVGGSVRDHFLGVPIKDYDIEVYGLESLEQLISILKSYGSVNLVGKSFGVIKWTHNEDEYDVSFPRRESKSGSGHRGFDVAVDGRMAFAEAARRRDFTINALGYDVQARRFLDPFGGLQDLRDKRLRHIDDGTFVEDPLRVYRAVQFVARFGLRPAEETVRLCRKMVADGMLEELPKERICTEWKKLLLKSPAPSAGFELMRDLGIIERSFPELHAIISVPQSRKWHPEGDVWIHTMMTIDAMATLLKNPQYIENINNNVKVRLLFASLCHDLGKATKTTIEDDGTIRAIGHEKAGIEPTRSLMERLTNQHDFIESILPLVEHHLKPSQFYAHGAKASAIRRLSTRVNLAELTLVAQADFLGRTTPEAQAGIYPAGEWLMAQADKLQVTTRPPDGLLQGRDLIALGLKPSPHFRTILDAVYAEQLEGNLTDKVSAIAWVKEFFL